METMQCLWPDIAFFGVQQTYRIRDLGTANRVQELQRRYQRDSKPQKDKRTADESSVRRRVADLFVEGDNEAIDHADLFQRFGSKCFKTKKPLNLEERDIWEIDHILPSQWLYPLKKENAALLSKEANAAKRAKWPSKFYDNSELVELARITGANLELISSPEPVLNRQIDINKAVERYLQVREKSDLPKRIQEIKKILQIYELVEGLTSENKNLLGFV